MMKAGKFQETVETFDSLVGATLMSVYIMQNDDVLLCFASLSNLQCFRKRLLTMRSNWQGTDLVGVLQ